MYSVPVLDMPCCTCMCITLGMGCVFYSHLFCLSVTAIHVDAVSNVTMARQGFPRMAIGACFGGPLMSILKYLMFGYQILKYKWWLQNFIVLLYVGGANICMYMLHARIESVEKSNGSLGLIVVHNVVHV